MNVLKYKGRRYNACAPRKVNGGKYVCDAWVEWNQRPVRSLTVLGVLAEMLMRGDKR